LLKILTAPVDRRMAYWVYPNHGSQENRIMAEKTCAACDDKIEGDPIQVKVGGITVEVCCEECAQKLREARQSARAGVQS
jgi:hypothetical protein